MDVVQQHKFLLQSVSGKISTCIVLDDFGVQRVHPVNQDTLQRINAIIRAAESKQQTSVAMYMPPPQQPMAGYGAAQHASIGSLPSVTLQTSLSSCGSQPAVFPRVGLR